MHAWRAPYCASRRGSVEVASSMSSGCAHPRASLNAWPMPPSLSCRRVAANGSRSFCWEPWDGAHASDCGDVQATAGAVVAGKLGAAWPPAWWGGPAAAAGQVRGGVWLLDEVRRRLRGRGSDAAWV